MARLIKSVFVKAPIEKAHAAWERFASLERGHTENGQQGTVEFIPAEGGCVVAVVLDYRPFAGPLQQIVERVWPRSLGRVDDDLEEYKRLAETVEVPEHSSLVAAAQL